MPVNQVEPCESVAHPAETFEAVGVATPPSATAKRISVGMLLLGVAVLWLVPLGGVLFLVAGGFGLAIASEADLTQASPRAANPAVPQASAGTPFDSRAEGFLVM